MANQNGYSGTDLLPLPKNIENKDFRKLIIYASPMIKRLANMKRPVLSLVTINILFLGLITACSSQNTQTAILFIDDRSSETHPLADNLVIQTGENTELAPELVSDAAKAHQAAYDKRVSSFEWKEVCEDGENCFEFKGVELKKVKVSDYFSSEENLEVKLPIDQQNRAVLKIRDGERVAEWKFILPKDETPLFLNIFVTEYFVSVTQLVDGSMSFTPVEPFSQTPERSWEFEATFKNHFKNYFQRDNEWIVFKHSYRNYSEAMAKANKRTCKVFGKDCDGRASYSSIASAYRAAYEKIVSPMLSNLSTYSDNKDVSVALLQLEKLANLHANCYFRSYSAAEDRDSDGYNATAECFSDVRQQESDLKISLKKINFDLESFTEVGYGAYPRSFE